LRVVDSTSGIRKPTLDEKEKYLMEQLNPLEKLNLLEKKIISLLEALRAEKELNGKLVQEKVDLLSRLEMLENSLLKGTQNIEELNQERVLTRMVVDDLLKNINELVETETVVEHEPQE
jgi:hypothetical protein